MNEQEIFSYIDGVLAGHDIYSVNPNRAAPDSVYYGGYRSDILQIRVSNHEKPYAANKIEITILVHDGMTESEVSDAVDAAIEEYNTQADELAEADGIQ